MKACPFSLQNGRSYSFLKGNRVDLQKADQLIKLAIHIVTLFGNGHLTSELALELVHLSLKNWFKERKNPDLHRKTFGIGLFAH